MTTDYREDLFPTYRPTSDTEIKEFKTYFRRLSGGKLEKLLNPKSEVVTNPQADGWLEFDPKAHVREFDYTLDVRQIANVDERATALAVKLGGFPQVTVPRITEIKKEGIVFDHNLTFNDTIWEEGPGQWKAHHYVVPFDQNLFIAQNIETLVNKFLSVVGSLNTLSDWNSKLGTDRSMWHTILSEELTGKTSYQEYGYTLDVKTFGNPSRKADTFTLAWTWGNIDFLECFYVIDRMIAKLKKLTNPGDHLTTANLLKKKFFNAARTIVYLNVRILPMVVSQRQFDVDGEEKGGI